jgi:hypothetical protein
MMPQSQPRPQSQPAAAVRRPTWVEDTYSRAGRSLAAGGTYFAALAGAGWTLGPIREFAVRRGLDPLLAVLIEAAPMLLVMALASAWTMRRFGVRDRAGDRLLVGSVAVTLVMAAEFVGGELVRGWGPYETLANLTSRPGQVFVALLIVALLVPVVEPLRRRTPA